MRQLLEEADVFDLDGVQLDEIIELFVYREGYARFNQIKFIDLTLTKELSSLDVTRATSAAALNITHSRELEESKEEEKKDMARTELEVAGRKSMTSIQVSPHLGPRPSLLIEVENDNGDV